MLVLPLPTPPERDVVINGVFDFLLESPEREKLVEVGYYLQYFLPQVTALQGYVTLKLLERSLNRSR